MLLLGAPPGIGRRLRPPATQPVCGAPLLLSAGRTYPCRGWRRLSQCPMPCERGGRTPHVSPSVASGPAVLSAHQRDSRRGVNLRSLPRPSDYRSATCATVSVRSRGQGLSASRENEPSRGDPLSHPDASPQSRPAWVPSGGGRPSLRRLASFGNPCNPRGLLLAVIRVFKNTQG